MAFLQLPFLVPPRSLCPIYMSIHSSIPLTHHIVLLLPIPTGNLTYLMCNFLLECIMCMVYFFVLVFLVSMDIIALCMCRH